MKNLYVLKRQKMANEKQANDKKITFSFGGKITVK